MKKDIEDLKAVADQLLLQETMNTVHLKLLTNMVLSMYSETLPEKTWRTIHRNYYERLKEGMEDVFSNIDNMTFSPISVSHQLDFLMFVSTRLKELDDTENG